MPPATASHMLSNALRIAFGKNAQSHAAKAATARPPTRLACKKDRHAGKRRAQDVQRHGSQKRGISPNAEKLEKSPPRATDTLAASQAVGPVSIRKGELKPVSTCERRCNVAGIPARREAQPEPAANSAPRNPTQSRLVKTARQERSGQRSRHFSE